MSVLRDRLSRLLQDPRAARLLQDPRAQRLVMKAFRWRGRIEGAVARRVQGLADALNLATQRDVRALQRRIRHLETALDRAEARLNEEQDARGEQDRS